METASEQLKDDLERYLSPDRHRHENVGEPKQKKILTVLTKEPVMDSDPDTIHFLAKEVREAHYFYSL